MFPVVTDRVSYCVVEQVDADGVVVKSHALEITDGVLDAGDQPDLVNAVCTTQLCRLDVKRDRSWQELLKMSDQGDLAGQPPLCKICKERAGVHRVYLGLEDRNYHLVTASSVALEDWTAICCAGRVDKRVEIHTWIGDATKCKDCDGLSGDAMRAQIAKAAGRAWEHE
jgi:hypothetical protein